MVRALIGAPMNIDLQADPVHRANINEYGTIEGVEASVFVHETSAACVLTSWSPVRSVTAHAPTRDEAIAEAVRMARACGMVSE